MNRLVLSAAIVGSLVGSALAQPTTSPDPGASAPIASGTSLPVIGEQLPLTGAPGWPAKLQWLYDVPSRTDATGKIVIHWFCTKKVAACTDDLARIVTLKENSRVYIVAYVAGSKADAKKLDPIRESEGVGRGTVAFGGQVTKLFKQMSIVGGASIVVDLEGKVAHVTTGSSPAELDARDQKVNALSAAIKEFTASSDGPTLVKAGDSFPLSITINLASWLQYSKKSPMEFTLMAPKEVTCDRRKLVGDQLQITGKTLTAKVTCSAPKGSYEVRGSINFGYDTPTGGTGLGADGARWNFQVK